MLQTYALASASHQQRLTHRAARCLIFIPAGISVPARVALPRACPVPSSQRAPTSPLAGRRGSTVQPFISHAAHVMLLSKIQRHYIRVQTYSFLCHKQSTDSKKRKKRERRQNRDQQQNDIYTRTPMRS